MPETGTTFIDTANIDGMGVSEAILGRWLASHANVTIARSL